MLSTRHNLAPPGQTHWLLEVLEVLKLFLNAESSSGTESYDVARPSHVTELRRFLSPPVPSSCLGCDVAVQTLPGVVLTTHVRTRCHV